MESFAHGKEVEGSTNEATRSRALIGTRHDLTIRKTSDRICLLHVVALTHAISTQLFLADLKTTQWCIPRRQWIVKHADTKILKLSAGTTMAHHDGLKRDMPRLL